MRILIVESRSSEEITDQLVKGAVRELTAVGAGYKRVMVPGLLEIPAVIRFAVRAMEMRATDERYTGYLALGCAIDNHTDHYPSISRDLFAALLTLTITYTLAFGNGVVLAGSKAEAIERCMPERRNAGGQAALACLRMIEVKKDLGLLPK